jgi:hypothetical protein
MIESCTISSFEYSENQTIIEECDAESYGTSQNESKELKLYMSKLEGLGAPVGSNFTNNLQIPHFGRKLNLMKENN